MTNAEKIAMIKTLLNISDSSEDEKLGTYLDFSKREIIQFKYSLIGVPLDIIDVPAEEETTQIMAVIAGYNLQGAENETVHHENGINRSFRYSDMLQYIRSNVIPYAKLM